MEAKALLKSIFATEEPSKATTDRTGAAEILAPPSKTRKEGDYLPIVAILVGLALLGWSILGSRRNQASHPSPRNLPEWEDEEATYDDD